VKSWDPPTIDGPRSFIIRSSLWIKNPSSSNYDNCLLAAAGATSNPESKGVELFVLPSPGHRFLPTAFVLFYCASSQLIVLVNTVRSSSCEYQSRRRARLACKIRFVPLAKHWYMLRPSLPLSLRGQRYRLLNWGELSIAIAYLLPCFTNLTSPERTIRSQWVWFLTALLYRHPIRPLPPAAQGTHRKPHLEPRNSPW